MKLYCKSAYDNTASKLHFEAGIIEVDEAVGLFLLRDAPENFSTQMPEAPNTNTKVQRVDSTTKAMEKPPRDKAVKEPAAKK